MYEIDAIGRFRFSEGTSADCDIQRTLMESLNQMDGFEEQGQEKMVMTTNRITKHGDIDFESVVKLADGLNGADMRNICTEAGLFAM